MGLEQDQGALTNPEEEADSLGYHAGDQDAVGEPPVSVQWETIQTIQWWTHQ